MAIVGGYHARVWSTYYVEDAAANFPDPPALVRETTTNFSWDGLGGTRWWRNWLSSTTSRSARGSRDRLPPSGHRRTTSTLSRVWRVARVSPPDTSYVTVSGAASAGNNGTFQINRVISATEIRYANPEGLPRCELGSISWSISDFPVFAPANVWGSHRSGLGCGWQHQHDVGGCRWLAVTTPSTWLRF